MGVYIRSSSNLTNVLIFLFSKFLLRKFGHRKIWKADVCARRGKDHMKTEVHCLQAKERLQEETKPADTLMLDF